jgi:hypothetical protein
VYLLLTSKFFIYFSKESGWRDTLALPLLFLRSLWIPNTVNKITFTSKGDICTWPTYGNWQSKIKQNMYKYILCGDWFSKLDDIQEILLEGDTRPWCYKYIFLSSNSDIGYLIGQKTTQGEHLITRNVSIGHGCVHRATVLSILWLGQIFFEN